METAGNYQAKGFNSVAIFGVNAKDHPETNEIKENKYYIYKQMTRARYEARNDLDSQTVTKGVDTNAPSSTLVPLYSSPAGRTPRSGHES